MTEWTDGYVADIGYTFGYYGELNPLRMRFALLNKGLVFPKIKNACELGFGQGLSLGMHAASGMARWYGTDFNPAQAAFAHELVEGSASEAQVYDQAFDEFASRTDLPQFDFIGLHGIWSWISDENRSIIVEFIKKRLAVGGVLYISYNTQPGWAQFAPIRNLLIQHSERMSATGVGIINRIDSAIDFTEKLLATNPAYLSANPEIGNRLARLKKMPKQYVAHEYFNRDWMPMHFTKVKEWLASAKIEFGCSANIIEHVDALHLTASQKIFLAGIQDGSLRENTRDFMVNQQFRKDYWVKGLRRMSALEQALLLREQQVILVVPRSKAMAKVLGALGEATLDQEIYEPLIDVLVDYKVHSLAELERSLQSKGINFPKLHQAIVVLVGAGHLALVNDAATIQRVKNSCDKLNLLIISKSRSDADVSHMVSPVVGGAIEVSRIQQLFILALQNGLKESEEWVDFVWKILSMQGQAIIRAGETLQGSEENREELRNQAKEFLEDKVMILKSLLVIS